MKKLKAILINGWGELRTGWRLAVGAAVSLAALYGVLALMGFAFGKLFEAWGLTNDNLIYAPLYARRIVFWHTDFSYALAYGASILASALLAKRWTIPAKNDRKMIGLGALTGVGCGALLTAFALELDSMRLEWPLNEPVFSASLVSGIAVMLLGCLCSEVLGKRLIFDLLRQRFGRIAGFAAVGILAALSNPTPLGMLNGVLWGLVGCVVYERGGILASAALRTGWMIWTRMLLAWPNSDSACLYRMYTVSDGWLTGGNGDPETGFGFSIILMVLAWILLRREIAHVISRMKRRRVTNGKD